MTRDVIDSVARLIFLLCAGFRHYCSYQCLVQIKWSSQSYTERKTTLQLTAATSSKIVCKFSRFNLGASVLLYFTLEYFYIENTYLKF